MTLPTRHDRLDQLLEGGVVGVIRGADTDVVVDIARAVRAGGVTAVEVTADTPGVTGMIEDVASALADDDVLVGAGTVLDGETARSVILAGAEFVVSPSVSTDVIEVCNRYGVPVAPGAATPTEVVTACEAGADLVKVFPAGSLGPDYVGSLNGPLGHIPLLPTGGVDAGNAGDFIEAGAAAVGVGSALVDDELVAAGEFEAITSRAEDLVHAVESARAP